MQLNHNPSAILASDAPTGVHRLPAERDAVATLQHLTAWLRLRMLHA